MAGSSDPSPQTPRARKPKKAVASAAVVQPPSPIRSPNSPKAEALVRVPTFPLAAFLWPARGSATQWEVLALTLMVVGLFRWAAGLWGYSGKLHHA